MQRFFFAVPQHFTFLIITIDSIPNIQEITRTNSTRLSHS